MKKILTIFLLSIIGLSGFSQVPTNGLIGYWSFTGNANDASGNGNNGVVNGATLTTDRFGNANSAYDFHNGQNITVSSFNINYTEITVSCWYKASSNWDRVFQHDWNSANGVFVITPSQSYTNAQFKNSGGQPQVTSNVNTCDNAWHNVVIAYWLNERKIPLEQVQLLAGHRWISSTLRYRQDSIIEQREIMNKFYPLG